MRLAAFTLIAISATVAHADTLAPSVGEYYLSLSNQSYDTTLSPTTVNGYYSSSSPVGSTGAVLTGGLDPTVGSFVGSADPALFPSGVNADAYGYYEFEVDGPPNQSVDVDVAGSLSSSVEYSNNAAYADLSVVLPSNPSDPEDGPALSVLLYQKDCAGTSLDVSYCGVSQEASNIFAVDQTISVLTDTAYVVELHSATSIFGSGGSGAASTADPTITLDGSDPAYSLQFSPGLLAPAPEPSSFALVGTALGCYVAGTRRMRRAVSKKTDADGRRWHDPALRNIRG